MNRFVMIVHSSDGCSWSARNIYPVLGESVDALKAEWIQQSQQKVGEFKYTFKGVELDNDYDGDPEFLTLDEWYEQAD